MGKITFVEIKDHLVGRIIFLAIFFVFGLGSSFDGTASSGAMVKNMEFFHVGTTGITIGEQPILNVNGVLFDAPPCLTDPNADCDGDGVTNGKEKKDGTDPLDSCDFILAHQNCSPSEAWKKADCDGDGVTNEKEKEDKTDPLDPCDFILAHQNCSPSEAWKKADCDGDGVTNEKEKEDKTDPLDPCDLILAHQNCSPSEAWKKADCDGDGVTNEKEKEDKTDPLDPCDLILAHQNCSPSKAWKEADCDGDGVPNDKEKEDGTDPLDSCSLNYKSISKLPSYAWKQGDCDGDGVKNWDEVNDGTDPTDPCDYKPESITLPQTGAYLTADCDGDGVPNETEKEDGTDPLDPCEFVLAHQTVPTTVDWNELDCDGDGVPNDKEKEDGTDPLDPCSYDPASVTLPQTGAYLTADCDGDGVPNETEKEDGTDPLDPCEFVLAHQTVPPTADWNELDCDGDGVPNDKEKEDGTDPLDPCSYDPANVTLPQTGAYLTADCDGDGVPNETEEEDGTDPLDPCEFVLAHQTVPTTVEWNELDCDGDGVPNDKEKEDGTDPLDPCSYNPESVTLPPSAEWESLDCDDDGNPNGTDPDPLTATARDDFGSTPAMTEVVIDILANDDYLPNNNSNNLGFISLTVIGGSAQGSVSLDADTGLLTYIPVISESNTTVTIIYQVCNTIPDPSVCASATVTIEVGANTLDAVDDGFSGTTDGGTIPDANVLSNDILNGVPVAPGDVVLTSTPTDELTINPDGSISIAPGTPEGTYTVAYTICEVADPTNCDTATVTVTVGPGSGPGGNTIDAVDDGFSGTTDGGTVPDANVLSNDTLNGVPVAPGDVVLTSTPTDELTINPDGSISIAPGTPEGTYTVAYTICEVADPTNCDTATVTVTVGPGSGPGGNTIDAVDDGFSGTTDGGTIPDSNVLSNDTLNGVPVAPGDVVLTSTPTDELTINPDGSISIALGTPEGTYTVAYTICEVADPDNCDSATVTVVVEEGDEDGEIEVNQLVTPNGDGKNDFLFIRGVKNAKNNTLQIFNRWGVAVYEGKGYNNQNNVFDGRSKGRSTVSGNEYLPAGVYYYVFQYENKQRNITDSGYIYVSK